MDGIHRRSHKARQEHLHLPFSWGHKSMYALLYKTVIQIFLVYKRYSRKVIYGRRNLFKFWFYQFWYSKMQQCWKKFKHSCDLLNTSQLKVMLWYRWSQLCLLTSYYREHRMAKASLNICVLSPCQTHFILNSKTKPLKTAAIRVFGSYSKFWTNLIYFHLCIFHTILIEFFLFFLPSLVTQKYIFLIIKLKKSNVSSGKIQGIFHLLPTTTIVIASTQANCQVLYIMKLFSPINP